MLQDTIAGLIISHRRPHLVQSNTFIDGRIRGNEYRKPELATVFDGESTPDGLTDKAFGEAWNKAVAAGTISVPETIDAKDKEGITSYKKAVAVVLASLGKTKKEDPKA